VTDYWVNTLNVSGVPLNTTCWFILKTDGVEISSNNMSCTRGNGQMLYNKYDVFVLKIST